MNSPDDSTFEEISKLITNRGPISFETFMEHVLYSANGFYSRKGRIGAKGDYFTSPSLHPVFGSFLAVQIYTMWKVLQRPRPFALVEFGSGDGLLAKALLNTISFLDKDFEYSCEYFSIDRFHSSEVPYLKKFLVGNEIPITNMKGVVFSNELIDALPVRLIEVSDGKVLEVFVDLSSENTLVEILKPPQVPLPDHISEKEISSLEGYRGPVNDRLIEWYGQLGNILESGFVITIDYGFNQNEYYSMENSKKLIQTYYKHVQGSSPYQRIGRQDITAHADFSALKFVGERNGFLNVYQTTQRKWLVSLGFDEWIQSEVTNGNLSRSMEMLINNLVDPNGLGKFQVLIQHKGSNLIDKGQSTASQQLISSFRVPEVTDEYIAYRLTGSELDTHSY